MLVSASLPFRQSLDLGVGHIFQDTRLDSPYGGVDFSKCFVSSLISEVVVSLFRLRIARALPPLLRFFLRAGLVLVPVWRYLALSSRVSIRRFGF